MKILPMVNYQVQTQNQNSNPNFNSRALRVQVGKELHYFLPNEVESGVHFANMVTPNGPVGAFWIKCKDSVNGVLLALRVKQDKTPDVARALGEVSPVSPGGVEDISSCIEEIVPFRIHTEPLPPIPVAYAG